MRIPTNSTFTKEISKQFKRIFHKDMSLGSLEEIKNLQENDLINPVDSYLENQVTKIRKANATKTNVQDARAVRSKETDGKKFVETTVQSERTKERFGV
jgi:hypothetical protein